jgi:hypothetical protein
LAISNLNVKMDFMRTYIKMVIYYAKKHPLATGLSVVIGAALGILLVRLSELIISDISKGLNEGSLTTLSIIGFVGSIGGLISLVWLIYDKILSKPQVNLSVELIDKGEVPDKIKIQAVNYGGTTEINKVGFILSDGNTTYVHLLTGLLPHRVRSGGVPYTYTFDIKEVAENLKKTGLSLKDAYVVNDNQKSFTCKIPSEIIQEVDSFKIESNE